jgi:hypothetical protein
MMKRVLENDEKYEEDIDELTNDEESVSVISDCAETGNFREHSHTLKHMGIIK